MCKNAFLAGLLGSQYLLEILEVIKNTENLVKCMCFQKCLAMESDIFLRLLCKNISNKNISNKSLHTSWES